MVAVVRKVYNRNSGPHLGVLAPEVHKKSFSDCKKYKFISGMKII